MYVKYVACMFSGGGSTVYFRTDCINGTNTHNQMNIAVLEDCTDVHNRLMNVLIADDARTSCSVDCAVRRSIGRTALSCWASEQYDTVRFTIA